MNTRTAVLVIGGGPAGSTAAALLAKSGIDVVLLEREVFPRYHIGESLLASCISTLKLSGAYDAVVAKGFQIKRGGLFHWAGDVWVLDWKKLVSEDAWSWQVDRAEYDEILLRNATRQGAKVIEAATVKRIVFDGDRPVSAEWISNEDPKTLHTTSFEYLIDASGRAGLLAQKHFQMRKQHEIFQNVAMWAYWRDAKLLPDSPEGAINVVSEPDGWWWGIPLAGNRFSIGFVLHKARFAEQKRKYESLTHFYNARVKGQPEIQQITSGAAMVGSAQAEQDYSYVSDRFAGSNYRIVGDAACFLDPLLSTGVHLAQYSGTMAAASIASALRGEVSEQEAVVFYEFVYRRAYTRLLVLVSRLYQNYKGKDDFFWNCQKLVHKKLRGPDSASTFTEIIAGITDMKEIDREDIVALNNQLLSQAEETQDAKAAVTGDGQLHSLDMSASWEPWRSLLGADTTVGDLRLVTEPRLGLARKEAGA